jgi:PPOX class probable F420-dependent enzyme
MPDLTPEQARGRFVSARVARLATVSAAGRPHLVPVTFAAFGPDVPPILPATGPDAPPILPATAPDVLVTAVDHKPKATTALARLANIAANPAVSLLVDHYDEDWTQLWWTRADGHAKVLTPEHDRDAHAVAVGPLAERYVQYRERPPAGPAILISVRRWSGWQWTG